MRIIRLLSFILLLVNGISAIICGLLFMIDPSGNIIHIPLEILRYSPFTDFLIPGILLFLFNGVLSLLTILSGILKKPVFYRLLLFQGIILVGWILIQAMLLHDFNLLHKVMLTISALMIIFSIISKNSLMYYNNR